MKRLSIALVLAICCLIAATTARADAPAPLGGVELVSYCQSLGYVGATLQKGYVVGDQAAYDNWRCVDASGNTHPFSMVQACQWMYGIAAVDARALDPNDAFSWVCYSTAHSPVALGGVELVSYCQSLGFAGATLQKGYVVGEQAAYNNWRCTDATGATHPFSMERACQWMYGITAVLAQPLDPNDAFSWVCYAAQPE